MAENSHLKQEKEKKDKLFNTKEKKG